MEVNGINCSNLPLAAFSDALKGSGDCTMHVRVSKPGMRF
jgi:hypothetical protein